MTKHNLNLQVQTQIKKSKDEVKTPAHTERYVIGGHYVPSIFTSKCFERDKQEWTSCSLENESPITSDHNSPVSPRTSVAKLSKLYTKNPVKEGISLENTTRVAKN